MTQRTVIVTGANSGIGKETAVALASQGDRVVIACRNPDRSAAALAEKPELRTTAVLMVAIPETMVILGFVIAVLIVLKGG